jgi:hypothetical protein
MDATTQTRDKETVQVGLPLVVHVLVVNTRRMILCVLEENEIDNNNDNVLLDTYIC